MNNNYKSFYIVTLLLCASIVGWCFYKKGHSLESPTKITTLIVGTNSEFPPFVSIEGENLVGFDIDIIKEVARRLQKKITFKDMPFDALLPELQLGHIHVIAAGLTPTDERAKRVFFTTPHLHSNPLVIVTLKTTSDITSVHDLTGKVVAANEGYTGDMFISNLPGVTVSRLSSASIGEGILSLQTKRSDAFVTATASIKPFLTPENSTLFKVITIEGTSESDSIAVSKQYPELFALIEKTIAQMKNDGTLETIKQKWNLHD